MDKDYTKIPIKRDVWDVIQYVNNIFAQAVDFGASDIHIEPSKDFLMVRFRQDWDFFIVDRVNRDNISAIITRLKVLAKVKIDENKKPQDGKIVYNHDDDDDKAIDIRFSTLPTNYWEKVVMRILKQDDSLTNLEALWFIEVNTEKVREALRSKYGIMLVAWPTGSGKSTTLFGILKHFNPLEYNISTLEDPIEYDIDFVNQSQVKPEIGYTFSSGLRSLVRQDPDIIMVWEIRDTETAILAVEAALTWHLVLSTIHTNSAAGTVQRLINMWVEPFLLASAMKMVISQRLAKRMCKHCRVVDELNEIKTKKVKDFLSNIMSSEEIDKIVFHKWAWCEKCKWTWYKGRLGIHEVLIVWDYLEPLILEKESANNMKKAAVKEWMITIVQDAILKAAIWDTTVEEAFKLI